VSTNGRRTADLLRRFSELRDRAQLRKLQRPLLIAAVVLFVVMTAAGIGNLPDAPEPVRWWLLALILVTTPVGVVLNAAEYRVSALMVGQRASLVVATRVAVLGSAFNLLPIPGAVLVRTQALRESGSSYKRAIGTAGVSGAAYLAMGFGTAGAALVPRLPGVAASFLVIAALFVALTVAGVRAYVAERRVFLSAYLLGVELGSVVIKAVALLIIGRAVGYRVALDDALVVNLSTVVTAAVGILPAGLGLRELLAGLLSPLAGLDASVGLVITAFSRILSLAMLALMAGVLALAKNSERTVAAADDKDAELGIRVPSETRVGQGPGSAPRPSQRPPD
jgi:hypothetical protein